MIPTASLNDVETDAIRGILEEALSIQRGAANITPSHITSSQITRVHRRRSEYTMSWPLEEVDLEMEDGSTVQLIFKDLSPGRLVGDARRAKPTFLRDPRRELDLYTGLLSDAQLGTAVCYGTLADDATERYWLFLERVPGVELYQVGEVRVWESVARWLAGFHTKFAGTGTAPSQTVRLKPDTTYEGEHVTRLISYDESFYRRWPERALEYVEAGQSANQAALDALARIVRGYDRVIEALLAYDTTVIHGECYASNVLVAATPGPAEAGHYVHPGRPGRVCPVDWEMAAFGPGLIDLAALTSGKWAEDSRQAIAAAYYDALPIAKRWSSYESFLEALDVCRLHVAMQWLGWAREWSPPAEHAQDWLADGVRLADRLGV